MSSRVTWEDSQLTFESYQLLHYCWADESASRKVQCKARVPVDLDHPGLCDRHIWASTGRGDGEVDGLEVSTLPV